MHKLHLTSDSSVDSSRDPVSCKHRGERFQKNKQHLQLQRIIVPTCFSGKVICNGILDDSTCLTLTPLLQLHTMTVGGGGGIMELQASVFLPQTLNKLS